MDKLMTVAGLSSTEKRILGQMQPLARG
jgi:hypothetical protein